MFGDSNRGRTRKTDKVICLGLNTVTMETCYTCAIRKSKQKNVPNKIEHEPVTNKPARIYIDNATVNNPDNLNVTVPNTHYKIKVDEIAVHNTPSFYYNKSDQI